MLRKFRTFKRSINTLVLMTPLIALADINGIEFVGKETITLHNPDSLSSEPPKKILVNKIKIDNKFKEEFRNQLKLIIHNLDYNHLKKNLKLNPQDFNVDLGMSNVPVLDQGQNDTCSLFATSAWLDANFNAGDYLSQQCLLELGVYLNQTNNEESGWEGITSGTVYLNRVNTSGAISKTNCPDQYADKTKSMDTQTYWNYSNGKWSQEITWNKITRKDINALKQSLDSGERVYIEVLLHKNYVDGFAIDNLDHALWDLPPNEPDRTNFVNDVLNNTNLVGHGGVVTGYSDTLKILKIRNSWGAKYGDKGEFYMSYDFYQLMNSDAYIK